MASPLILLGISLLFGRRTSLLSLVVQFLLIGALVAAVFYRGVYWATTESEQKEVFFHGDPGTTTVARLQMDIPAGILRLRAQSESVLLYSDITYHGLPPRWEVEQKGDVVEYTLSFFREETLLIWAAGMKGEVTLANQVPWHLVLHLGAGKLEADLTTAVVNSLEVDVGAGELHIVLGDAGKGSTVRINSGVGKVTVGLPKNVGIRISSEGGITSRSFSGLREMGDGVWVNDLYGIASTQYDVVIASGVGSLEIDLY